MEPLELPNNVQFHFHMSYITGLQVHRTTGPVPYRTCVVFPVNLGLILNKFFFAEVFCVMCA